MTAALNLRELIEDYSPADYAPDGFYDECTGEFHEPRRAGDRYTGPRMHQAINGFLEHDALAYMATFRRMYLSKRAEYEPITDWQWDKIRSNRKHHYELQRMRAYRPVSQLVLVDILARSEIAERMTNALVAAMRGAA